MNEKEAQELAIRHATEITHALRWRYGWGFVAIALWRATRGPDEPSRGSGASYFEVSHELTPFVPRLAENLDLLAAQMRKGHRLSGAPEAVEAYSHVVEPPTLYHGEVRCPGPGCVVCATRPFANDAAIRFSRGLLQIRDELARRRDVARGPEAATYWTAAEARAVGDELDEVLAYIAGLKP